MKHPNFSQCGIKQIMLFCIIIMYYTKIFLGVVSVNFRFEVNIYLYTTLILMEFFFLIQPLETKDTPLKRCHVSQS